MIAKIGGVSYSVHFVKNLKDKGARLNGHIKYDETNILIESRLSDECKRVTLWHEVVHGLLTQAGIEHDERTVEVIGYGIVGFFNDNKDLLDGSQPFSDSN